jgi:hypothetical protein
MINLIKQFLRKWYSLTSLILLPTVLVGCGGDPPPPQKEKPRPVAVVPQAPTTTSVADLMDANDIDDRIWMDERRAPNSDMKRVAVLRFFNGFATGNADQIRPFLGEVELHELATLEASGELAALAAEIDGIEIQAGTTHEGRPAILGLYEFHDRIEGQMWEVDENANGFVLKAAPAPPGLCDQLGADPFADWYAVVASELLRMHEQDLGIETAALIEPPSTEPDGTGMAGGGGGGGGPSGR